MTSTLWSARLCFRRNHAFVLSAINGRPTSAINGRLAADDLPPRVASSPLFSTICRGFASSGAPNEGAEEKDAKEKDAKDETVERWRSRAWRSFVDFNVNRNNEFKAFLNRPLGEPFGVFDHRIQLTVRHAVVGTPLLILLFFGGFLGFFARLLFLALIIAGLVM